MGKTMTSKQRPSQVAQKFFDQHPDIVRLLKSSKNVEQARKRIVDYIYKKEQEIRSMKLSHHPMLNVIATDAMYILRTMFAKRSESLTHISTLKTLMRAIKGDFKGISDGFFEELRHRFLAVKGKPQIYKEKKQKMSSRLHGRAAALFRSKELDSLAKRARDKMSQYRTGLEKEIIQRRRNNRKRILRHFGATLKDWKNYKWHFDHVIKDMKTIEKLVNLPEDDLLAIDKAVKNHIPFGITPYYLSLFDNQPPYYDLAVRAQVLPPPDYVDYMAECKNRDTDLDFMGEHDTSPVELITRRYPNILILKPYNACPQVCTYCQRNWEIDEVMAPGAKASEQLINKAIKWIKEDPAITEVLITGGDPFVLSDEYFDSLLKRVSNIDHIINIRIGTRTLVTVPQRITDKLVKILKKYNTYGRTRICIVTHFENAYEITPEAMEACRKIRNAGISIYNQFVYTLANSRRFEACVLRQNLRAIGVDPYYTFNTKGHEEMNMLRVPIARLLQEQKEEARLLPGLTRTDEAVFNVPRLGKNHLRAQQDHNVLMIAPNGCRVYVFHPWEKNIAIKNPYIIRDVPIHDYLKTLEELGEDPEEYSSIWYYY